MFSDELQKNIQEACRLLSYEDAVRSLHQVEAVKDKLVQEIYEEKEVDMEKILEETGKKITAAQNTSTEALRFIENIYKDLSDIDKELIEKE